MKSLIKYIQENFKFRINKDSANLHKLSNESNNEEIEEKIKSLFDDGFFEENPDIELCMYPKSRWGGSLREDIINAFHKHGNNTNPCYKGLAWQYSSNHINKEACKVWTELIKYIKENKDNLDLLMCKEGFHSIYIINTNDAIICFDGDTDIYYSEFSDAYIIIQYK